MSESFIGCEISVHSSVDYLCGMLYSHAYGKRLGHDIESALNKCCVGISCAMSYRKDQRGALYLAIICIYTGDFVTGELVILKFGMVHYPAAKLLYSMEHSVDNYRENVGADMRLRKIKYLLGRSELNKALKNVRRHRIVNSGNELSVREGACATRAELDIGVYVKDTASLEILNALITLGDRTASLDYDGIVSVFGK